MDVSELKGDMDRQFEGVARSFEETLALIASQGDETRRLIREEGEKTRRYMLEESDSTRRHFDLALEQIVKEES